MNKKHSPSLIFDPFTKVTFVLVSSIPKTSITKLSHAKMHAFYENVVVPNKDEQENLNETC